MGQEKYTAKTMAALQAAQQMAAMRYHQEITSLHVLLALAKEPEGLWIDSYQHFMERFGHLFSERSF